MRSGLDKELLQIGQTHSTSYLPTGEPGAAGAKSEPVSLRRPRHPRATSDGLHWTERITTVTDLSMLTWSRDACC